jgi:hypothetical protein
MDLHKVISPVLNVTNRQTLLERLSLPRGFEQDQDQDLHHRVRLPLPQKGMGVRPHGVRM